MGKIEIDLNDLKTLLENAKRINTTHSLLAVDQWIDLALQWMEAADKRIAELEQQLEDARRAREVVQFNVEELLQEKTGLREALELAVSIARSWIHDQLDGTYMIDDALKKLEPAEQALKEEKDKCTHAVATQKPNMTNPVCRLCGEPVLGNKE